MSNQDVKLMHAGGAVRVVMPAKIANNLTAFQNSLTGIAAKLGCGTCFSGRDCTFVTAIGHSAERNVAGANAASVNVVPGAPAAFGGHEVTALLSSQTANKLELVKHAVAEIAGKLGCSPCCSGFDLYLQQELEVIQINEQGTAI